MSALSIQPTYPIFTDIDGQPLEAGFVWIGVANAEPIGNPINVYWDAALTIPATQPIRTLGGYPSNSGTPARLYVNSDYSIQVQNKNGSVVYSAPVATERYSDDVVNGIDGDNVSFLQAGVGAVVRTMQNKAREWVSVKDFGAVGDGVADDRAAIQACLDYANSVGKCVLIPNGTYKVLDSLIVYDYQVVRGQGWRKTMITGALANKSIIRTQYGEAPTYAQRTIGWDIGEFSVTNSGVGSIGLNFGNVGYSNVINMGVYNAETGLKCTQRTYYTCFINLTCQGNFVCADLQSDGGANEFINPNFGFGGGVGNAGVKITSGSWKFNGGTIDTNSTDSGWFFKVGQNGYATTASLQISNVYVEGVSSAQNLLHFYDNVITTNIYGVERRGSLGPIVYENTAIYDGIYMDNAGQANPAGQFTRRVAFTRNPGTGVIDAYLKSLEGNTLQVFDSNYSVAAYLSLQALFVGGNGFQGAGLYFHTASPEGAITAAAGSLCIVNTSGGMGATGSTYKKTAGTGNTGWVAI